MYANGLLNSQIDVIYFGVTKTGIAGGIVISHKQEDEYRLACDRVISNFEPFVSANHYRLTFLSIENNRGQSRLMIIELKVSVGDLGEIYEDGHQKVYLVDETIKIGPLDPQEIKELVLLKYKESIEGAEEANNLLTPHLMKARQSTKINKKKTFRPCERIEEEKEFAF